MSEDYSLTIYKLPTITIQNYNITLKLCASLIKQWPTASLLPFPTVS